MASPPSSWSDLLPDLLGLVLIRLPLPADRARFRAVCRAWHSAARLHARRLPWIVFPDGSFGTIGHGGGFYFPAGTIPGLPENVTCLGAAAVGWLALDCTDDEFRRTHYSFDNRFLQPRGDVKHRHSYRLYNPFTGETVLLPELDSIIGEVPETFDICKVLKDGELVAITTSNYNYNIIICRPGKGNCCVLRNRDVFDVAFHGNRLYGITPEDELVALDLAEDDNGAPIVTKCWRVIKKPLADGEEDHRSWMYEDNSSIYNDDDDDDDDDAAAAYDDDDGDEDNDHDDAAADYDDDDDNGDDDDETLSQNGEEYSFNLGRVPSGVDMVRAEDKETPYDVITTTRRLVVQSCGEGEDMELLMVRHRSGSIPSIGLHTLDVDIFKADMEAGNWVPVRELAEGEALFLSRSFSKSIHAYGDIKEGCIYYTDVDAVFDTKSRDRTLIRFPGRWQGADHKLLSWLFPPQLQL